MIPLYFWLTYLATQMTLLSALPILGTISASLSAGIIIWIILFLTFEDTDSTLWFWALNILLLVGIIYTHSIGWHLFSGILSGMMGISALVGSIYDMKEQEGLGIFGLLFSVAFFYLTYTYI